MLYFAWVRERIGRGEEDLDAPAVVAIRMTIVAGFGWFFIRNVT